MGFFGPSKRERQQEAERLEREARDEAATARKHRATAAKVRDDDRRAVYRDREATRIIARQEEGHARAAELAARDLKAAADRARNPKPWWR